MNSPERFHPVSVALTALLVAAIGAVLILALWSLPPGSVGLSIQVRDKLPDSGVSAEVTAVLLNFRGYDTLLELAVLLAALLGAWQLGPLRLPRGAPSPGPVLESLIRFLVPATILVAAYVLWLGGHSAGGAFQAGALLGGAGVLLLLIRPEALALHDSRRLRALLIAGPALFVLVAGGVMLTGRALLEYPRTLAGGLILLIEATATLSIAAMLALLFAGGRPRPGDRR